MTTHTTDPRPHHRATERTAVFTPDPSTSMGSADLVVYPPTWLSSGRPVYRVTHLPRRRRSWRPWLTGLAVLLAVAAAGGLVWLTVLAVLSLIGAVTAAIAWAHTHWLLCVLAGIAVLALVALLRAAGSGSDCAGLHCGGCRG
ncbi:MAG: hypothetical protein ACR2G2_08690 [Pseudonocardia sp.]